MVSSENLARSNGGGANHGHSMAESGTQFEPPNSRPTSSDGKLMTAGRYTPYKQRSKSTEPRSSKMSMNNADDTRKSGGSSPVPNNNHRDDTLKHSTTKFPSLTKENKPIPDSTPFLLPLQRVYAPNLLINHSKSMRSTVRIAPSSSLDESMSGHPRHGNLSHSAASMEEFSTLRGSKRASSAMELRRSATPETTQHLSSQQQDNRARSVTPSIFGGKTSVIRSGSKPLTGKKTDRGGKGHDQQKQAHLPSEEVDVFVPSAKELREAKELFRQFDTDGDGTLTMSEIQASLYFNNVDYEEIQAIFGPNGIKGLGTNGRVSVEEFAAFLCRRRRENANRQQSSHVSKYSKIIRVYVSSCVHQHHAERKILQERVFPKLAELIRQMGGELVQVDLRYHAGECGASLTGPTQAEAMAELARVSTDRNYFFLGLIGDFPGESVLPSEVSMSEFETLKASAKIFEAASDEKGLPQALENIYVLDKNSTMPTYVLRESSEMDMSMVIKAFVEHEGEEKQLHSSFSKVRAKIAKSLNEQEFTKCLSLGSELDQAKRSFLFMRTIDDLPFEKQRAILPGKNEEEVLQVM
jgi:hypothetical protein